MIPERFVGSVLVYICIAVNAAVRAGVIGADIGAFCAAAFFSRRLMIVRETIRKKQLSNNTAVNAMGLFDTIVY